MAYNSISSYKNTSIQTASPAQLIVMLYDEAVKQLDRAIDLLGEYDKDGHKDPSKIEPIGKALVKTQSIVTELAAGLDFEKGGELANNLFGLYNWFNRELAEANIQHDRQRITVVRNLLSELRATWAEVAVKVSAEGSMQPTPVRPSVNISF